ncbi:hypothetical protein D3C78_1394950 [compost metagenome]
MALRAAGGEARHGPDMLFKLRDYAGRFRPVAGIVNAWRHFIGNQRTIRQDEEFDADDADIFERGQKLLC